MTNAIDNNASILNTLSKIPNWPAVVFAALLAAYLGFYWYKRHAKDKFKATFDEVYAALDYRADVTKRLACEKLVAASASKHDAATVGFRRWLKGEQLTAFSLDCEHYRQCRQHYQEFVGRTGAAPDLIHAASEFRLSIEKLTGYAK